MHGMDSSANCVKGSNLPKNRAYRHVPATLEAYYPAYNVTCPLFVSLHPDIRVPISAAGSVSKRSRFPAIRPLANLISSPGRARTSAIICATLACMPPVTSTPWLPAKLLRTSAYVAGVICAIGCADSSTCGSAV